MDGLIVFLSVVVSGVVRKDAWNPADAFTISFDLPDLDDVPYEEVLRALENKLKESLDDPVTVLPIRMHESVVEKLGEFYLCFTVQITRSGGELRDYHFFISEGGQITIVPPG